MTPPEILDPFEPFQLWFRGLSKTAQWVLGVPIIVLGLMRFWHDITYVPAPDEPAKAFWVTLILFVVSVVLNELLRPKPNIEQARPKGLGDFQLPTATEGRVVPLIFGKVRQKGPNVIWYGDLLQEAITEKVKTGMWSSERITKGFKYHLGVQMAISRGPGCILRKVWVADDEVYTGTLSTDGIFNINKPELFGGDDLGSGGILATCDFYTGSTTQAVNAYLDDASRQRITSAATPTAPRYTGTCHIVAREYTQAAPTALDTGAYFGNSTSIKPWSFEAERYPAAFTGQLTNEHKINLVDCNPINVIREILTNDEWGFGEDDTALDLAGTFLAASDAMVDEDNGFSMLLDNSIKAKELLNELQRQIDGVVYINQATGKWTIQLARGASDANFGYDIDTVAQLTDSNVAEVRDFTRGAWEDTTNTITVKFNKRDDDYKESYALAQDTANAMMQGNGTISSAQAVSGAISFPGVKDRDLASNLAWRELRGQSYPLARCTLVINRDEYYSTANGVLAIGSVIAFTNATLGFTKLPMRVTDVDYGKLQDNKIRLTVVQDVFNFAAASYASPPATQWTAPSQAPIAFPTDEQIAFEAPRAVVVGDPNYGGEENVSKVWCGAAVQAVEVAFDIMQSNSTGDPGGATNLSGTVFQLMKIGALNAAVTPGDKNDGNTTLVIKADASSATALEAAFDDSTTKADMGQNLAQLILVGDEFMLVTSATLSGTVTLAGVYRGALDSGQTAHAADDQVYMVFTGGGLADSTFDTAYQVDIKLLGRSAQETLSIGAATEIDLLMDRRTTRPYPPAAPFYNSVAKSVANSFGTPDLLDSTTGGENGYQFAVDWWRRLYNNTDEVAALEADVDPDGASLVSATDYQVSVFADGTEIASSPFTWTTGTGTIQVPRSEIIDLMELDGVNTIRIDIDARHTYDGTAALISRNTLQHEVIPADATNTGLFYLGGGISNGISAPYVVANADTHTIRLGAAMTLANAQYRINGGSWVTIAGTSGTTASLSVSDTIEVWADSGTHAPDPNFIYIEEDTGVVRVAYGTL